MVITARAGTPLVAIEAALESPGKCSPASRRIMVKKPPGAGGRLRAGGAASPVEWFGPRFFLGTRIITGTGKHLRFGGEV